MLRGDGGSATRVRPRPVARRRRHPPRRRLRARRREPLAEPVAAARRSTSSPGCAAAPTPPCARACSRDFELDPRKKGRSYSKGNRQKVALVAAFARPGEALHLRRADQRTRPGDGVGVPRARSSGCSNDGATVLLSSHILSEVEQLCDRVTIVRAGKAVETGALDELRHLTRTSFRVADGREPRRRSQKLPGVHDARAEAEHLVFDVDTDAIDGVLAALTDGGRQLADRHAAVARGAVPAPLRRPDRRDAEAA